MRIFERLRTSFGLAPTQLQTNSKETREETVAVAASATEPMCCGHCSGNAEGHISELPSAR
ncbi:hypothetical protein ACO2JO_08215 [Leptospira interrogans]